MKIYGIVSEYNPFHNGHKLHIERTRESGATHIAAVMSGNFVQRGDVAVIDKFKRARIAVANGVDLVIELPVVYSLATAELFARAGVMLLCSLGVGGITFGSECGDVKLLHSAAQAALKASATEKIKPLLDKGIPFPEALQSIIAKENGADITSVFDSPNNTLAVEYIKALNYLNVSMYIYTVKREGAMHDGNDASDSIASGSRLRAMIKKGEDISAFVPPDMAAAVDEYRQSGRLAYFSNLERAILYRLRIIAPQEILDTPDIGQGLHNRVYEMGRAANSLEEYFRIIGTKRYTMARMRRILLNLFMGIKNIDLMTAPPYGRVLALNERGAQILKKAAENKENNKYAVPFMTSAKGLLNFNVSAVNRFVELSSRASDIYGLASQSITPSGADFTAKIEIQ